MLRETRAIVLNKINYSDTSLIVKVYSRQLGLVSLFIKGAKRARSKTPAALFESFNILELVLTVKENRDLFLPKEVRIHQPLHSIQSDPAKRMISIFLSEVIHKSLKEGHTDRDLYDFIENAIIYLDASEQTVANFHLWFMLEMLKYSGFYPARQQSGYFDLEGGIITARKPTHNHYREGEGVSVIDRVLGTKIDMIHTLKFKRAARQEALNILIDYFRTHYDGMREIHSHKVLETVID